ncbi:RecX family transcriptional regulator [Pedobacter sp. UBA4863]|uniref:regulatory protein RecX n=1 Tax=Pedobacter sp. UBA4863 TaxID=1947060 RepID=UPI0025DEE600|nr:RecX family transcriptional regulator [Pedobacter sp. UBA4863]
MKTDKEKTYNYDKKTALQKAANWCAYQERSQQEVRDKLYEWQMKSLEVEEIISTLIAENFLNEERFAFAYVSGKFKIKKWGKIKIKQGLKLKRVPDTIIKKALNSIDGDEYVASLRNLLEKKQQTEKEKNAIKRQFKLVNYLHSKGYEKDLIFILLKNINL